MKPENLKEKLSLLCRLIETEFTGTPEQLAIIIGVTERTLRRYIEVLRQMGADIRYSRSLQTYYFASARKFELKPEYVHELA